MSVPENSCEVLNGPHTVLRCDLITVPFPWLPHPGRWAGCTLAVSYLYNNKIRFPFPQYIF